MRQNCFFLLFFAFTIVIHCVDNLRIQENFIVITKCRADTLKPLQAQQVSNCWLSLWRLLLSLSQSPFVYEVIGYRAPLCPLDRALQRQVPCCVRRTCSSDLLTLDVTLESLRNIHSTDHSESEIIAPPSSSPSPDTSGSLSPPCFGRLLFCYFVSGLNFNGWIF